MASQQPPDDPEEWSDEQWLAWLQATDQMDQMDGHHPDTESTGSEDPEATVTTCIARSSGARALGEAMRGMARAMYGQQYDEVVIVAEGSGEPGDDEPFTVHLDPDHPERSTVVFKPGPS